MDNKKELPEKIDQALNESRILVLVTQVMLGFQYQAVFQPGFERLPRLSQTLKLGGLSLMLLALALLMAPAAYHRIVMQGNVSGQFHQFITKMTTPALLPLAIALGMDFYVMGAKITGPGLGVLIGLAVFLVAVCFWYGIEWFLAAREQNPKKETTMPEEQTPLEEKVKFVLTEARVVLPGAQALLGFQFAAVLTDAFEKLPAPLPTIHLASLACVAVCTVLLMAPAAFHRIVEQGEDTERLHSFASKMILGAMAFLALGMTGDVVVVMEKVLHSSVWAITSAVLMLVLFYGLWFGYMLVRRAEKPVPNPKTTPAPSR